MRLALASRRPRHAFGPQSQDTLPRLAPGGAPLRAIPADHLLLTVPCANEPVPGTSWHDVRPPSPVLQMYPSSCFMTHYLYICVPPARRSRCRTSAARCCWWLGRRTTCAPCTWRRRRRRPWETGWVGGSVEWWCGIRQTLPSIGSVDAHGKVRLARAPSRPLGCPAVAPLLPWPLASSRRSSGAADVPCGANACNLQLTASTVALLSLPAQVPRCPAAPLRPLVSLPCCPLGCPRSVSCWSATVRTSSCTSGDRSRAT